MMNLFAALNAFKNPQQFIANMMQNNQVSQNPMAMNAMNMYQQGNINGLQQLAENLAKEKGTSVDEIRKKIGI